MQRQKGISVIEVLIALGFAAVVIATVGNVLVGVHRVDAVAGKREQALGYAREGIELLVGKQDALFNCSCPVAGCPVTPTVCTASDGQTCSLNTGYSSCWTACPRGFLSCTNPQNYPLESLVTGAASLTGTPFIRAVTLENLSSTNVKRVTTTITDASGKKWAELTTELTGWKNIPTP